MLESAINITIILVETVAIAAIVVMAFLGVVGAAMIGRSKK
jgi:hypothetical protein